MMPRRLGRGGAFLSLSAKWGVSFWGSQTIPVVNVFFREILAGKMLSTLGAFWVILVSMKSVSSSPWELAYLAHSSKNLDLSQPFHTKKDKKVVGKSNSQLCSHFNGLSHRRRRYNRAQKITHWTFFSSAGNNNRRWETRKRKKKR